MSCHQQHAVDYLKAENSALREQLGGERPRFTDAQRCRLARAAKPLDRARLGDFSPVVSRETLLRWYRDLVAAKYDGSAKRSPGRLRVRAEIQELIVKMATENPRWGYTRIQGALWNLGNTVGRNTIKRILVEKGIDPVGQRTMRWSTFLKARWGVIAATNFFTIEALTWHGLVVCQN